jgi:CIC family chloride channel protein
MPLPLPQVLKPALGGLALGGLVLGLTLLISQVPTQPNLVLGGSQPEHLMAGGHGYLQTAVNCALDPTAHPAWTSFMLAGFLAFVVVAKIAATCFTLGSGGSGGLLFPALFLGGITGAAYAKLVRAFSTVGWVPDFLVMTPNARAGMILVGMGGVFAACTKTPIASLVMVSEITGSYGLLVPLMMTCTSAYLLSRSFSLSTEQVPGIADSPAHRGEFMLNVLEGVRVSEALPPDARPILIPENTPFQKVLRIVKESPASVFPIVNEQGCVTGIFSIGDMRQVIHEQSVGSLLVAGDLTGAPYAVIAPDDGLDAALRLFTQYNTEVLAVANPTGDQKPDWLHPPAAQVVGILLRRDLVATYHRRLHDLLTAGGETEDETHVFIAAREAETPDSDLQAPE